jgi:CheY-like chemotaxis protein
MMVPRVLVVDDEPAVLDLCRRVLRKSGIEVVTAPDAQATRCLLETQQVDLLIADIRLPEEDGITLLEAVHELTPDLPLMIMTGYPDATVVDAALNLNVKSFVVKPFDLQEFVSEVQRSLDLPPTPKALDGEPTLPELIPPILDRLRRHNVPILEGVIHRDPTDGRTVLVPGKTGSAVPVDEFLSEYTQGERVYLIVLPHY